MVLPDRPERRSRDLLSIIPNRCQIDTIDPAAQQELILLIRMIFQPAELESLRFCKQLMLLTEHIDGFQHRAHL